MTLDSKAGPCVIGRYSFRHTWDPVERNRAVGTFTTTLEQWCKDCARSKVIVYSARGNHIAGYYTREKQT